MVHELSTQSVPEISYPKNKKLLNPLQRHVNGFNRWLPRNIEMKAKVWELSEKLSEEHFVYGFTRRQSLEKRFRRKTGLNWRSRLLSLHCKPFTVTITRVEEPSEVTKPVNHRLDPMVRQSDSQICNKTSTVEWELEFELTKFVNKSMQTNGAVVEDNDQKKSKNGLNLKSLSIVSERDVRIDSMAKQLSIESKICADFDIKDYKDVINSRNFTGKVVLVTGSSSGIGEGISKLFSILGANVVVTGRKEADVQKVATEVQELSPKKLKPLEVVGDLTQTEFIATLIGNTIKTFGKLDVLVNNAGIYPTTNITQTDLMQVWDQVFNTDLRAVVELIHESVPHLEKTNGTIIDISSIGAIAPLYQSVAYGPAKAGLDMITRVLALELGPKGIRVNTLNPGAIQVTDKVDPLYEWGKTITPLKRLGQPLDIAKGVAFLASSDASFITGANLVVDGGLVYNIGAFNTL
ncbi:unnamed protein product [Oppiella nova]|uniref:Uncharacterized protein n=1 Tax=Oppiella nova TaxID=334625 RepID=A0A7R9M936_9ACAR|nr:unnamed protein product [Oppiella nova]CAG2173006.1 unnamed protein product [Oppiella nova]